MQELSIIIPTWNEEENITKIVERIHAALSSHIITYQIIFIDDYSTDRTTDVIENLMSVYPIELFLKEGNKGKAQSLIEGFAHAKYDLLCMIDGDLQYPPEAIPEMVKLIKNGVDVVVANRKEKQTTMIRTYISNCYSLLFNKLIHNFDCDVQSGLKVFRREIIERIHLQSGQWAIDLELLIKAKNAGYKIVNYDIIFAKRDNGKTKINLFKASWEIGVNALLLKFRQAEVIPFHPKREITHGKGFHYKGKSFIHHSRLTINEMAFFRLDSKQKLILICMSILFAFSLCIFHCLLRFCNSHQL